MVSLTLVVEKFALDRLDPIDAYLEFDGTRISGVPLFDAPATDRDGIAGVPRSRFAPDSPLEGDGFELSVPGRGIRPFGRGEDAFQ
jgi:hypothetical protein